MFVAIQNLIAKPLIFSYWQLCATMFQQPNMSACERHFENCNFGDVKRNHH